MRITKEEAKKRGLSQSQYCTFHERNPDQEAMTNSCNSCLYIQDDCGCIEDSTCEKCDPEEFDFFEKWFAKQPVSQYPELFSIISIEGKDLDVIIKEAWEAGAETFKEEILKDMQSTKVKTKIETTLKPYFEKFATDIFEELETRKVMEDVALQAPDEVQDYLTRAFGHKGSEKFVRILDEDEYQAVKKKYGVKHDNKQ